MDYMKFGVENFLSDTSFQQYCLGNDSRAVEFWSKWIIANPEKKSQFETARKLYFNLNGNITNENFKDDFQFFKTAFFRHIHSKPPVPVQIAKRKPSIALMLFYGSSIAACIIVGLLLLLNQWHNVSETKGNQLTRFVTAAGKKRTIFLNDHTRVMLNGGSTLTVEEGYNKKSRNIQLEGEAFFQVSHNPRLPFIVHTSRFDVRVLGTIFNVRAYSADKLSETTLLKGSVRVTLKNAAKSEILLIPHEKVIINNQPVPGVALTADKKAVSDYAITSTNENKTEHLITETAWTHNRLIFEDKSLDNISATLVRWYGVKIVIQNPEYKKFRYTAAFENDDITHVLNTLQLTNHFNYRKEGNEIVIY